MGSNIVELVGLIGSGKTTIATRFKENMMEHLKCDFETYLETEEVLKSMVHPMLECIYKEDSSSFEYMNEFLVEVIFAIIRLAELYAFFYRQMEDREQHIISYVNHLFEAFDVEYHMKSKEAFMELREKSIKVILGTINEHGEFAVVKKSRLLVDRGVFDVLIFITERIQRMDPNHARTLDFLRLFSKVVEEILDIHVPLGGGVTYTVVWLDTDINIANEQVKKRGRDFEVDEEGNVRDRVLSVNYHLNQLYKDTLTYPDYTIGDGTGRRRSQDEFDSAVSGGLYGGTTREDYFHGDLPRQNLYDAIKTLLTIYRKEWAKAWERTENLLK